MYIYIYIQTYIHTEREREEGMEGGREGGREREREREREVDHQKNHPPSLLLLEAHVRGPFVQGLALSIADIRVVPFFYAALQPAVTKTGFRPPPQMEEYVQDMHCTY